MPELGYKTKVGSKFWLYKLEGSNAVRVNQKPLTESAVKELAKQEGLIVVSQKKASAILTERKQHENRSHNS